MPETKPYRNVLRSKRLIQGAYLSLLLNEEIARIKTKDVIELANVSKGTFYAHYTSLQDVQQEIEREHLDLMFRILDDLSPASVLTDFQPLFLCGLRLMEEKRDLFRLLFRASNGGVFLDRVKQTFLNYMFSGADQFVCEEKLAHLRGYLTFVAGGALTMIQDWLQVPNDYTAESLARHLNCCAQHGLPYFLTEGGTPKS